MKSCVHYRLLNGSHAHCKREKNIDFLAYDLCVEQLPRSSGGKNNVVR